MEASPQKEHEWLQRLVGAWSIEMEAVMAPDQPPARFESRETVRSLGGLWVLCEGQMEVPGGGTAQSLMTLGYDPARRRFVGTFVASMMSHLWVYDGALEPDGRTLVLDTEGPSQATPGKSVPYKDAIEFDGEDRRVLTSRMLREDGEWVQFMRATYRREG